MLVRYSFDSPSLFNYKFKTNILNTDFHQQDMKKRKSQVFQRMTDLAKRKIRELPDANFDHIRSRDGIVLLTEVPDATELALKNHF